MSFPKVNPKQSFPALEEEVLAYWKKEKMFEKSLEQDSPKGEFKFFDGPPFATGLPHYGHILQGVIKDLIPRYKTMQGYKVPRVWGWDCHGLPVENLIEKDLDLKSKQDVEKYGVDTFNEACRESVLKYAEEWKKTVARMGRWIDMEHAYKTMDLEYMDSVWWVFGELWKKGLIYEGLKPMHICPRCETPLSNFEVGLGYKDITDLSATVKFELEDESDTYLLAWTTTPWTLPGNVALAVGEDVEYAKVKAEKEDIIIKSQPISPMAGGITEEWKAKLERGELGETAFGITRSNFDKLGSKKTFEEELKEDNSFLLKKGESYWIASKRLPFNVEKLNVLGEKPRILSIEKGKDLVSKTYKPLFSQFANKDSYQNVPGLYFITFNTENSAPIFKDESLRNACADIFREVAKENNYSIYDLVIMPDHIHLVINIDENGDSLPNALKKLKGTSSHKLKPTLTPHLGGGLTDEIDSELSVKVNSQDKRPFIKLWRKGYDKKFIFSDDEYANVSDYIQKNPEKQNLPSQTYDWLKTYDDVNQPVEFPKEKPKTGFRIVAGDFVTTEDGTGIVHIAPAFGEDDYEVAKQEKLPIIQHVSLDGKFVAELGDLAGLEVKPAKNPRETDEKVVDLLEKEGKLFAKENYKHSYPHCWRCDTPLLNYATSSWFVNIEKIKEQLLKNNQEINWIPTHIRDGRFGKWLEGARDWAISRNRFWGAPLPIWRCETCGETKCVGSKEELEKLGGGAVEDLHKHFVDQISWECKKCKKQKVEVTFVRHGETDGNAENKIHGSSDIPLNTNGEKQAEDKKAKLNPDDFDVVISSPLQRAKKTAEIIVGDKEIILDENLKEKDYGEFEGKSFDEVFENYSEFKTMEDLLYKVEIPGGETNRELNIRLEKFIADLQEKYSGKKVLVVCHSGVMRHLIAILRGDKSYLGKIVPNLFSFDHTLIPQFKRIPEVLDCWFESGSMPYAQFGEKDQAKIPADFIGEAQDQTRGWFYTLHVLATALKGEPVFKNCTCTGLILAEDGEKMSKSKQNFPPPQKIFDNYGADAMRLYLMQSPVTHAEDLRFSERGVEETLRSVLLPLWNTFYFFTTYANADGWEKPESGTHKLQSNNQLDHWILSELNLLIKEMTEALDKYEIQKAVTPLAKFLDGLTNWYIRRSRRRFWKSENDNDKNAAYETLFHVLTQVSKLLAPICPFIAEKIYRDLTGGSSVHLEKWPEVDEDKINEKLSGKVFIARNIISLGLAIRARENIRIRQPLSKVKVTLPKQSSIATPKIKERIEDVIDSESVLEELNVKKIEFVEDPSDFADTIVKINPKILGPRVGNKIQKIIQNAKNGDFEITLDGIKICDEFLNEKEAFVIYKAKDSQSVESQEKGIVVALDTDVTPELELEGQARDLVRVIQDLRKKADYDVSDRIELQLEGAEDILKAHEAYITAETLAEKVSQKLDSPDAEDSLGEIKIGVKIIKK